MDLLGSKFTSCIHVITQIDPAEGTLAQELPPAPIDGGTWGYRRREGKSFSLCTLFIDVLPDSPEALYGTFGCVPITWHYYNYCIISTPTCSRPRALSIRPSGLSPMKQRTD